MTQRGTTDDGATTAGIAWRRWLFFAIFLLPLIALALRYVQRTFVDVVWLDALIHIPMIGRFLDGNGSLSDLVGPFFGEHLLFGYRALLLVNAELFSLDMRLDPVMFVAASATLAAIVYADFTRLFPGRRPLVVALLSLPLVLLCFSLVSAPGALMSTQFVWGTVVALLAAWLLQMDFLSQCPRESWWTARTLAVMVLTVAYFFMFSGAYFPGFLAGVAVVVVARWLCTRRERPERRYWVLGAVIVGSAALYAWLLASQTVGGDNASGGLSAFFSHPLDTLLSYATGVGSSLVDIHTIEGHTPWIWPLLGFALLAAAVAALILFVKTRMYEKTYLPLYCLAYPLGVITMVRIGRAEGSWAWMGNEWYAYHYRFFVIGVVWILLYAAAEAVRQGWRARRGWRTWTAWTLIVVVATAVLVGSSHIIANGKQWRRGPYVRYWLEEKRNALLYPQYYDDADLVVLSPGGPMDASREILKKYSLSSFSRRSLEALTPDSEQAILRFDGWSGDDWIGKRGAGAIISETGGTVRLEAFVPDYIAENRVTVLVNGEQVFAGVIPGGETRTFSASVREGMNVVSVRSGRSASPAALGIGADQRFLGVRLTLAPD